MLTNIESGGYNFRYSTRQWQDYARFLDFIYEQQRKHGDDLVQIVILRSVAQSQVSHDRGVNASSLASALDLPRETVRRKCLAMTKDGWLQREGDDFRVGPRLGPEVLSMVEDNIARLVAAAEDIRDASGKSA